MSEAGGNTAERVGARIDCSLSNFHLRKAGVTKQSSTPPTPTAASVRDVDVDVVNSRSTCAVKPGAGARGSRCTHGEQKVRSDSKDAKGDGGDESLGSAHWGLGSGGKGVGSRQVQKDREF